MVLILYLYVTVYKYLLALTYMAVHISYVASLNHTLFSATQVFITCKLIWMSEVLQPLCNSLGASGVLCGVLCEVKKAVLTSYRFILPHITTHANARIRSCSTVSRDYEHMATPAAPANQKVTPTSPGLRKKDI